MNSAIKEDGKIYWGAHTTTVMFLIPKKKGKGFLKVPVGHHRNELSTFVTNLGYDCDGLDGYLNVWFGYTYGKDEEIKVLVENISKFHDTEAIEVDGSAILDYCLSRF